MQFCTGSKEDPKPIDDRFDEMRFTVTSFFKQDSCTVKEWVQSIQGDSRQDRLTELDRLIDRSIGGRGGRLEYVLGRLVPLFEFRNLFRIPAENMEEFVTHAEHEVERYHKAFADSPKLQKRTCFRKYK